MRTAPLLGVLLTLTLLNPALAQDTPQDPQGPLAADLLAELLLTARDKKVLQHRLFTKRFYRADQKRGEVVLVTGEGSATEKGFQFKLAFDSLGRKGKGSLTYDFNAEGRLTGVSMMEARGGEEGGLRITIANGVATQEKIKPGRAPGKARQAPWTGDMVSLFSAMVLIPSLGDLGSEKETRVRVVGEDDRIGRSNARPGDFVIRRGAIDEAKGVQVVMVEDSKRSRPIARVVLGVGKDQGVIKEFVIDPKPDGRYDIRLTLISEKESQELEKLAPLIGNESKAKAALRQIWSAQRNFSTKQGQGGNFASSIEDLANAKLIYDKGLKEGTSPGYLIMVRAAASGTDWMAVAVPDEPDKTGRYYYVTNKAGVTYRSKKPIELDDSCQIPAGLEKVR